MIERNVDGLKKNAQKKRRAAFEKVDKAIQQLIRDGEKINFNSVAKASGVSKAWLYKEPEVKVRIEELRAKHSKKKISPKQKASDASKDAMIKTLKVRIKKVDAENKGLKSQLEVVYGQLLNQKELERKLERLEKENAKLKDKLYAPIASETNQKVILIKPASGISERITHELESMNINISSTLAKTIKNASEEKVMTAIDALKQQIDSTLIRSPEAWLSAAIKDSWKPNEAMGESKAKDAFSEWYELARAYGVVTECRQEENKWLVRENTGQWHPYKEFSEKWTFEYLERVVKPN
ncbi:hypothetical protein Xen7305DRAFT_00032990 [Xenococcus sp. PCC 7305]|uniref:DUF6262 family protein n=1 Tax=Xenococcus sp. PCC 7305 TaxID=102125 RepID=UPI0002ABC833|nr:DUF6262 family protein [Xenococcus sp. PCC 7305]ELS03575.1 hypothetical protein Xen7305DRAFT_00032990 [Xenococcus sp. PCC 7305]